MARDPDRTVKGRLNFDGGSRGNPGPSSAGVVLLNLDTGEVQEVGMFLGHVTNNEAEYMALCLGLRHALDEGITDLEIIGDSRLIVEHVKGQWECKAEHLRPYLEEAWALAENFDSLSIQSVPRKQNKQADKICNEVMDHQESLLRAA